MAVLNTPPDTSGLSEQGMRVAPAANATFGTGEWSPYYLEVYAFVASIYWLFIFSLGQYGEYLGKRMAVAQR